MGGRAKNRRAVRKLEATIRSAHSQNSMLSLASKFCWCTLYCSKRVHAAQKRHHHFAVTGGRVLGSGGFTIKDVGSPASGIASAAIRKNETETTTPTPTHTHTNSASFGDATKPKSRKEKTLVGSRRNFCRAGGTTVGTRRFRLLGVRRKSSVRFHLTKNVAGGSPAGT